MDDEPHLRFLLEQTLEDFEDYNVKIESVENGQLALDSIKNEKPDLMFLDEADALGKWFRRLYECKVKPKYIQYLHCITNCKRPGNGSHQRTRSRCRFISNKTF